MTRAMALLGAIVTLLSALAARLGMGVAQDVARVALVLLGGGIAAIFLWLWHERATPLALAMTFSWAGATAAMGWWLATDLAAGARVAQPVLLGFLAVYLTGTLLHLQAIRDAFGLGRVALVSVIGGAAAASVVVLAMLG